MVEGDKPEDVRRRRTVEDCDEEGMADYRIRNDLEANCGSHRGHRYNGHRVLCRDVLLGPGHVGGKTVLEDRSLQVLQKKLEVVEVVDRNCILTW